VNDIFAKRYRYRRITESCVNCGHSWRNRLKNRLMCDGTFTKEGMSTEVELNGICKMYYPEKMEVGK
jgi:hypothetical protein